MGRHVLSWATGVRGSNGNEANDPTAFRFSLSVETKTEIVTVNTGQVPVQTDTSLPFNIELNAYRTIRNYAVGSLFNW